MDRQETTGCCYKINKDYLSNQDDTNKLQGLKLDKQEVYRHEKVKTLLQDVAQDTFQGMGAVNKQDVY